MRKLRRVIKENIPPDFEEVMQLTPAYVVPLSLFPAGYHCSPDTPLPFLSLASQKNFIAIHHFGMYADPELMQWFVAEYPRHVKSKLDMGKSCIRLKKMDQVPYELIGTLASKRTALQWVKQYQKALKKS